MLRVQWHLAVTVVVFLAALASLLMLDGGLLVRYVHAGQSRVTRLFTSENRQLRQLYFKNKPKDAMTAQVIVNLLEDENNKFRAERLERLHSLNATVVEPLVYDGLQSFMKRYLALLNEYRLLFPHPQRVTSSHGKPIIWETKFLDKGFDVLSENDLDDAMHFDDEFIEDLKVKHRVIVSSLPTEKPKGLYSGSGYVMVGGGVYSWYSFLSIQQLRVMGAKLPLEVIMPKERDRKGWFCDELLPKYNAKCITFEEVLGTEVFEQMGHLKGYQLKSFALLCSSFETAMYLDSDNFAVRNPDPLFTSKLYQRYQMITWPDFWRRTDSPALYSVLGVKVGHVPVRRLNDVFTDPDVYTARNDLIALEENVNFHDRNGTMADWSTESGQFLLNKTEHFNTLLLALYYNYDGPAGYHPLLSQGGAGEGDKETYALAAHYLHKPFYQVYRRPDKLYGSYIIGVNWFVDSTIVQMDPLADYNYLRKMVNTKRDIYNYDYAFGEQATQDFKAVPMFYHIHAPKIDPFVYIEERKFFDPNENMIRNFGENFPQIGFDLELMIWRRIKEDLCTENMQFDCFKGRDTIEICYNEEVEDRINWLEKTGKKMLKNIDIEGEIEETDDELDQRIFDRIAQTSKFEQESYES